MEIIGTENFEFREVEQNIPRYKREIIIPGIEVSEAGNDQDKKAAKDLIFEEYKKEKYIVEGGEHIKPGHGHETSISSYLDREGSVTFVAKNGDDVIGAISIVLGKNSQGKAETLPMETSYEEEIRKYRDKGDKIAEVTQLALKRKEVPTLGDEIKQRGILIKLFELVLKKSFEKELDDLVIAINPKLAYFYKDSLKFEDLGGIKKYKLEEGDDNCVVEAVAKIFKLKGKNEEELLDILYSLVKRKPH